MVILNYFFYLQCFSFHAHVLTSFYYSYIVECCVGKLSIVVVVAGVEMHVHNHFVCISFQSGYEY